MYIITSIIMSIISPNNNPPSTYNLNNVSFAIRQRQLLCHVGTNGNSTYTFY